MSELTPDNLLDIPFAWVNFIFLEILPQQQESHQFRSEYSWSESLDPITQTLDKVPSCVK